MAQIKKINKVYETNEEKSTPVYKTSGLPTSPAGVTHRTPVAKLNLNWHERDLPEKERTKHVHRLHPYLGKFIPQLVEIFLRKFFTKGQTVLDPFCGSGTTLVQANELGINAIGYDVSIFNVLLCQVKVAEYDYDHLEKEIFEILDLVRQCVHKQAKQGALWKNKLEIPVVGNFSNDYLNNWYAPQALEELLLYKYYIETGGYKYKNLQKIILSRAARSARLTTHFDLDFPKRPQRTPYWCHKHSRECAPTQTAFKFLKRYSIDTLKRIREFSLIRTNAKVEIHHGDSRDSKIPNVHGIITSPPYVGLIDYHEQHAYSYHLLGLEDKREKEIGPAVKGASQQARKDYVENIKKVFKNAIKGMPRGGPIIIVANDKHNLYLNIMNSLPVKGECIIERHVNRRTGRRNGAFYESVFVWRKN